MGIRIVTRACRWCGRDVRFAEQLVIGGAPQPVTEAKCIAPDRILLNGTCEPSQIEHFQPTARKVAKQSRAVRGRR